MGCAQQHRRFRSIAAMWAMSAVAWAEVNTWQGVDMKAPTDWHVPGNWSAGSVPGDRDPMDVVVPSGLKTYPELQADAVTGGSLRVAEGARLTLNGHALRVGAGVTDTVDGPNTVYTDATPKGLVLDKGGSLDCTRGTSLITVRLGGFVNRGKVFGTISLRIDGTFHGFVLDSGQADIASIHLGQAVYPYAVTVTSSASVSGNVELAGGNLTVASGQALRIGGDMVFRGSTPRASVTLQGNTEVHGTVTSEGSSRYVGISSGWVRMVGPGDQTITAGGILPPIRLAKPSGKVTVKGDLHCAGLHVDEGNTLDLSQRQSLIFGVPFREWKVDPKSIIVIYAARPVIPARGWRGLTNQGTIVGSPSIPFRFHVAEGETLSTVTGIYSFKGRPKHAQSSLLPQNPHAGDLSVGEPDSRITFRDNELLLDGRPAARLGEPPRRASKEAADEGQDEIEGADEDEGGPKLGDGLSQKEDKAQVLDLVFKRVSPPAVDSRDLVNIAPHAASIRSTPPLGAEVYNLVDGSQETVANFRGGVTQFGAFEFIFAVPVTVSVVRFLQTGLWSTQYVVYGDTTDDGECGTVLAWGSGGAPEAWRELSFLPTRLHRLKFRSLGGQCGWELSSPILREFEIYADRPSFDNVAKATPLRQPGTPPANTPRLSSGQKVDVAWPTPPPEEQVTKLITADLWMLGISNEASVPANHLRESPTVRKVIDDLKAMGADGTLLFIEANMKAFWPSANFESMTNEKYFADRRAKALPQLKDMPVDIQSKDTKDDSGGGGLDLPSATDRPEERKEGPKKRTDSEPAPVQPIPPVSVRDLPNQRDLLKELCEAMHENGLKLYFIVLGRFFESYVGPPGNDAYALLIDEVVSRGVDGISLTADEATMGMFHPPKKENPEYEPTRLAFKERFGPDAELPPDIWQSTVDAKRWLILGYERIAGRLKACKEQVKKINPRCATFTNIASSGVSANNRMTYGTAYDVIGHIADLDYLGTDYQEREQRVWTGAARNRRGCMELFVPRLVREGIQCVLQGARLVSYYRYNYIEMQKSADHRRREFAFINAMARWGATRPIPARIALVVSRASEDWWDNNHGTNWLGWNPVAKQGFWTHRGINAFLLDNGYTFDLYYLDQVESLRGLGRYRLVILPFPYSISREAVPILGSAREAGSRLLIAQKQGEVDDVGRKYDRPALQDLIDSGQKDGSVVYLDQDFVQWEMERSFAQDLSRVIDGLLGEAKQLFLDRHGSAVETYTITASPQEQYLVLINRDAKPADIEVGVPVPEGTYRLLMLSSAQPDLEYEGLIDGQRNVGRESLARFAVKLDADEARMIYVVPADQSWGAR